MSLDEELFEEYLKQLSCRYTAEELVGLLELEVWDIIEAFREKLLDLQINDD